MGSIFSTLFSRLFGNQEVKIIIVGLDNAGKTTILYKLHIGSVVVTQPTLGSNVEEVQYKNIRFRMWDLGGQESLRNTWSVYYQNTEGIILVVDSTDKSRMHIIKDILFQMLEHKELANAKLLVFANKQDLKDAMSSSEVARALNLQKIKSHDWNIQACCALTGSGLLNGLDWLTSKIKPS